jgi:Fis family transcriptional regulator
MIDSKIENKIEHEIKVELENKTLRQLVEGALESYFSALEGQTVCNVHKMVIREVEIGLFNVILKLTGGNQSRAASYLGLARGTLRKRLEEYGLN